MRVFVTAAPPESRADLLLDETGKLLEPLVRLLIAQGVGFPQVSALLRNVFMQAAKAELQAQGHKITDAAISVRSGVHRKEVRHWSESQHSEQPAGPAPARSVSLAEQVFTRWLTDAGYRGADGKPAALAHGGPAPSFESLASSVSKDFSRRTVLDELIRLGLVREESDRIVPIAAAMVPKHSIAELARLLSAHVHDHLAAGAANIAAADRDQPAPFLEQSVYANGLSNLSVEQLSILARQLWQPAFQSMVDSARQRYAIDRERGVSGRIRFGVYFYSEPDAQSGNTNQTTAAAPKARRAAPRTGNKS